MEKTIDRFLRDVIIEKRFLKRFSEHSESFVPMQGAELALADMDECVRALRDHLFDKGLEYLPMLNMALEEEHKGTARSGYYWGFIDCISYVLDESEGGDDM